MRTYCHERFMKLKEAHQGLGVTSWFCLSASMTKSQATHMRKDTRKQYYLAPPCWLSGRMFRSDARVKVGRLERDPAFNTKVIVQIQTETQRIFCDFLVATWQSGIIWQPLVSQLQKDFPTKQNECLGPVKLLVQLQQSWSLAQGWWRSHSQVHLLSTWQATRETWWIVTCEFASTSEKWLNHSNSLPKSPHPKIPVVCI